MDPEYLKDRRVFGHVLAAFRYGREDLDVLGKKAMLNKTVKNSDSQPGASIPLGRGYATTLEALRKIIKQLKRRLDIQP